METKIAAGEWLKQAEELFRSREVVEISIGFEASAEQIALMAQRARELAGHPLLLSLTYKPYIMGGAEITVNGEYRDFTLRSKMSQLFIHKPQATRTQRLAETNSSNI